MTNMLENVFANKELGVELKYILIINVIFGFEGKMWLRYLDIVTLKRLLNNMYPRKTK